MGLDADEQSTLALKRLLDAANGVAMMIATGEADRERAAYAAARQLTRDRLMDVAPEWVAFVVGMDDAYRSVFVEMARRIDVLESRVELLMAKLGSVARDGG